MAHSPDYMRGYMRDYREAHKIPRVCPQCGIREVEKGCRICSECRAANDEFYREQTRQTWREGRGRETA